MKLPLNTLIVMLFLCLLGTSSMAQESQQKNIGLEFGYNGHVFDQANSVTWSSLVANFEYPSKAYLTGRFENNNVTDVHSIISPFINTSFSLTKSWQAMSLRSYWTGKVGLNIVSQETSVELESYTTTGTASQQEKTSIKFREINPMLNLSFERKYLLLPTANKINFFLGGGIDVGLGFGSKVNVTGQTENYGYEGTQTSETASREINETGQGANGYYYGGHVGIGPEFRIGNITLYGSFNILLAKLRKVNTATYDMLNTGFTAGIKF